MDASTINEPFPTRKPDQFIGPMPCYSATDARRLSAEILDRALNQSSKKKSHLQRKHN